jgi:hypothetical protein
MQAPFDLWLRKVFPNSPHKRVTLNFILNYASFLVLVAHYSVCVWLFLGDKYLLGDEIDPWQIANDDFHGLNNY